MAYKTVTDLSADETISLGGFNKKSKKENPSTVEGYYLGSRQVPDAKKKTGKSFLYILQTAKGSLGVWGKTDMDRKMSQVTPGNMIKITHTGMKPTVNGEMYVYQVQEDADNSIEVSAPVTVSTDSDDTYAPSDEYLAETEEEEYNEPPVVSPKVVQKSAEERSAAVKALLNKNRK